MQLSTFLDGNFSIVNREISTAFSVNEQNVPI